MSLRPAISGMTLALATAAGVTGCDLAALTKPVVAAAPVLVIPAPRPPEPSRKVDDALAVYPSPEMIARDPFLTPAEEFALRTGAPPPPPPLPPSAVAAKKKKNLEGLEAIEGDVNLIVFGQKDGRRTAVWRGRVLHEGQQVGDYRVTKVDETGIELRESDGPGRRTLRFRRSAASVWQK